MAKFPSVALVAAFILGLFLKEGPALLPILLCCLILLFFAFRTKRGGVLISLGIVVLCGAWRIQSTQKQNSHERLCASALNPRIKLRVKSNRPHFESHQIAVVEVLAKRCQEQWRAFNQEHRLIFESSRDIAAGDILILPLKEGRKKQTPAGIEASALYLAATTPIFYLHRGSRIPGLMRQTLRDAYRTWPTDRADMAQALSLGRYHNVSKSIRDEFSGAGTAHLLAISGLHLGIFGLVSYALAYLIAFILSILAQHPIVLCRPASVVSVLVSLAFVYAVGAPISAQRALLMFSCWALAKFLGRPSLGINLLSLAVLVLLLLEPAAFMQPGFQLSVTAVLALLLLSERRPQTVVQRLTQNFWAAMVIALLTTPILAWHFRSTSLSAPLANFLLTPFAAFAVTPSVFLSSAAQLLDLPGKTLFLELAESLVATFLLLQKPFGTAELMLPRPPILWVLLMLGLSLRLAPFSGIWKRSFGSALVITLWVSFYYINGFGLSKNEGWRVHFLDVGQGDATLIRSANLNMLVDGGGDVLGRSATAERIIVPKLIDLGITQIDLMILSHPHPDHMNGLLGVARAVHVAEFWHPGTAHGHPDLSELSQIVKKGGGTVLFGPSLPKQRTWAGLDLKVHHPIPKFDAEDQYFGNYGHFDLNDNSIVFSLSDAHHRLLMTGDIEAPAEALISEELPSATVVKVPHHGSKTSSTQPFITATQPDIAVISCGRQNQFKFPSPDVLKKYTQSNTKIMRTDLLGNIDIQFHPDGKLSLSSAYSIPKKP